VALATLRSVPFVTCAIGASLAASLVLGTAACSGDEPAPLEVGGCMRRDDDAGGDPAAAYEQVDCAEADAAVEVVALAPVEPGRLGPACPAGTDVALQRADGSAWQDLCLRDRGDDHPGDAGNGGGELTVGDCVGGPDDAVVEVPCAAPVDAGEPARLRVVAFAEAVQDCPPETTDPLDRGSAGTICAIPA
jgi:hypothetical protein